MNVLFLLLFSIIPQNEVLTNEFERAEINHFYDEKGRHIFDQVLWSNFDGFRNKIEAWRLVKNPGTIPILNRQSNLYESFFYDKFEELRKVKAKYMIETWTQFDPELEDREYYDKNKRKDLAMPIIKIKEKEKEKITTQIIQIIKGVILR